MISDKKTKRIQALNKMKANIEKVRMFYEEYIENREERWESEKAIETELFTIDIDFYGRENQYIQSFKDVLNHLLKLVKENLLNEYKNTE